MIKYNYENALIIILIMGITTIMFLYYEQKNIEGLRQKSNRKSYRPSNLKSYRPSNLKSNRLVNRFCNRCRKDYTKNSGLSDYCKANFYNDYT